MDIVVRGNALKPSETKALDRMQQHLRSSWFGYASVLMADREGSMEFDLIMVTHDRVLVVELKAWNGKLENFDGKWRLTFPDGSVDIRGKSAYHRKRDQSLRLIEILKAGIEHNLGYVPFVETHVVLCGSATPEFLTDTEKLYVHTLDDFLRIKDDYESIVQKSFIKPFDDVNRQRPNTPRSREVFNRFFRGSQVQLAEFKYLGYVAAKAPDKVHDQNLFKEYPASHPQHPASRAMMRRWNLNALGLAFHDDKSWKRVATREDYLYRRASAEGSHLEEYLLQPVAPLNEADINDDCIELYKVKKNTVRLQQYLASFGKKLAIEERLDLTRALLAPFVDLHSMGYAHRDIDAENLWFAQDQRIVLVSGFHASYIPERGTVKDMAEQLRCSAIRLPEDVYCTAGEVQNPFAKDVYLLALVAHRICFPGTNLAVEDEVPVWRTVAEDPFDGKLNDFFAKALDLEHTNRFANAGDMLADFNTLSIGKPLKYDDSAEVMEEITQGDFIKNDIMQYTMMDTFKHIDGTPKLQERNKVSYQCHYKGERAFLKFWPHAAVDLKNPGINRRILRMRKRIEKALADDLPIPAVLDYGMFAHGQGLYIVTEYVDGKEWQSYVASLQSISERLQAASALCKLVISAHSKEFAHGDLHPGNLLALPPRAGSADAEPLSLLLIDALDYGDTSDPYNVEYGPQNPSCTDSVGRDCFAVYKIVEELLGADIPTQVAEEIALAKAQPNGIPVSLDPLAEIIAAALDAEILPPAAPVKPLHLVADMFRWPATDTLMQQEGSTYHLYVNRAERNDKHLFVRITSQDKRISFNFDPDAKALTSHWLGDVSFSDYISDGQRASESFQRPVTIRRGTPSQEIETEFSEFLLSLVSVNSLIGHQQADQADEERNASNGEGIVRPTEIWQSLLEIEGKQLTRVEILPGGLEESQTGAMLIPGALQDGLDIDDLVASTKEDEVEVYLDGDNRAFGVVVHDECGGDILAVRMYSMNFRSLKPKLMPGTELILESRMSAVSRSRRNRAMQRVLSGVSKISSLPSYFDVHSEIRSKVISPVPEEKDIRALYDNEVEELNPRQVIAFQRMVSEGPVTALQGPPGTGKTAFVSKFIHFLFERGLAKNILLVGQSHASVDTVAIKAREVCENMGTEISVVRLGRETSIDDLMLSCHSSSIQSQIRHKFQREYEQRIHALSARLMLSDDLVEELAKLHRSINPLLEQISTYSSQSQKVKATRNLTEDARLETITEYEGRITSAIGMLEQNLTSRGYTFQLPAPGNEDFWNELSTQIARQHGVTNQLALQRLNSLIQISQDWVDVLGSGGANYEKFLTKTSQLVCGTLVGIGAGDISIEDMDFDFVIVDEAGRAQASELMIALQCGRRALLVGDHKQLPPVYELPHVKAVSRELQIEEKEVRKTDFERAFEANDGQTLSTQYRMIRPIGEIVSNCFYNGDLESFYQQAPDWCQRLPHPLNTPVTWIDSGEGSRAVDEDEPIRGKISNSHEVDICLDLLKKLARPEHAQELLAAKTEKQPFPIGVITMYRRQKKLIEEEISRAEWAVSLRGSIKIDTVDSYQGQENEILVLSLVRNNPRGLQGFLVDQSRINVALSRAKKRLVVIGSLRMWNNESAPSALGKVVKFISEQHALDPENYEIVTGTDVIEGTDNE